MREHAEHSQPDSYAVSADGMWQHLHAMARGDLRANLSLESHRPPASAR